MFLKICNHELDINLQAIRIGDDYIRLRNKLWCVLVCLVENKNNLVCRETLIDTYWNGEQIVGEQGITHTIYHLRKTFKQHKINATIITIPKRGYVLKENSVGQTQPPILRF